MRLGGPVFGTWTSAAEWAGLVRESGYSAAYCPVGPEEADEPTVAAYARAAREADIVIAEVGAWSNPISPRPEVSGPAREKCRRALALADQIGARCCVNIAGSRLAGEGDGPTPAGWDGPEAANLAEETFDLIVATVQRVIDAVRPVRTYYTLETMPWVYPDSAESYARLIAAVDRERFGVHLDPVNLVNSPARYFRSGELIRGCFARLGPHIRSCHAKDVQLSGKLTVHLDEVCPGDGGLDYRAYLHELARLDPDTPLMLEHLASAGDYARAARHLRGVADRLGLAFS